MAALDIDCNLYLWGNWQTGEKISYQNKDYYTPILTDCFKDKFVIDVGCGNQFTTILCSPRLDHWKH